MKHISDFFHKGGIAMEIERVTHYVDNVLTQAEARMGLRNTRLLVA